MLTLGKLSELIKELAPTQYNSIIIDNAVAIKEYRYCYIRALTQKVEFRSEPTNYKGKPLPSDKRVLSAKYKGEWGMYTQEDVDYFKMEVYHETT